MLRLVLGLLAAVPLASAQEYDLVIRRARIVDGSGGPSRQGDVAVRDGLIAAVGIVRGSGRVEINAAGRVVSPGFVDVHTHAEDISAVPSAENYLRMGITTIITGNCGSSKLDVGAFFRSLERTPVAVNVASLVGHGTIRRHVMGGNHSRPPTPDELSRMERLVERAMQNGAVGLSTGLIYLPGTFADTDELIALARAAGKSGGLYASHMRHENHRIRSALEELIRIAREARVPAQVSHLKLSGPAAWGRSGEILDLLDRARAEGLTINHDVYVYTASSTGIGSLIAPEFREGGTAAFIGRMKEPATKAAAASEMKSSLRNAKRADFSYAVISGYAADPRLNGKSIPEAATLVRGSASLDDQIEMILGIEAQGGASGVFHGMSEPDMERFLCHPRTMIGSDSGPRKFGEAMPHPRGYGNSARLLARYVRDRKLLSLEEGIRKMSALPAETFHLGKRGLLRPGFVADIVVFDPRVVEDVSQYHDPHHYAVGFSDVIVNGVPVIRGGSLTGARPGRPVKRSP